MTTKTEYRGMIAAWKVVESEWLRENRSLKEELATVREEREVYRNAAIRLEVAHNDLKDRIRAAVRQCEAGPPMAEGLEYHAGFEWLAECVLVALGAASESA